MKKSQLVLAVAMLCVSVTAWSAPVINSIFTNYSATGVPTSISVVGTGLCATNTCTQKPAVTLGGVPLSGVSGTTLIISANLGLIPDGDYVLKLTAGASSTTFPLTVRAKTTGGTAATVSVGATTTGLPGSDAAVANTGTSSAAILRFTIPRGAVGPAGIPGATGATGAKGDAGAAGPKGDTGAAGTSGLKGDKGDKGLDGANGVSFAFKGAWS